MAAQWSLDVEDGTLMFNFRDIGRSYGVSAVTCTRKEQIICIKLSENIKDTDKNVVISPIECYLPKHGSDDILEQLILATSGEEFVRTLHAAMRKHNIHFQDSKRNLQPIYVEEVDDSDQTDSIPIVTTPTVDNVKKSTPPSFRDIVVMFRNLHPDQGRSESTLLDTKRREWRRKCQEAVGKGNLPVVTFGGNFKEHLSVAAMSDRCFKLALEVLDKGARTELKDQKTNNIGRSIFMEVSGVKCESELKTSLLKLVRRQWSPKEFSANLKSFKQRKRVSGINMDEDNRKLKAALAEKDEIIQTLTEENRQLKEHLKECNYNGIRGMRISDQNFDVYLFKKDEDVSLKYQFLESSKDEIETVLVATASSNQKDVDNEVHLITNTGTPSQAEETKKETNQVQIPRLKRKERIEEVQLIHESTSKQETNHVQTSRLTRKQRIEEVQLIHDSTSRQETNQVQTSRPKRKHRIEEMQLIHDSRSKQETNQVQTPRPKRKQRSEEVQLIDDSTSTQPQASEKETNKLENRQPKRKRVETSEMFSVGMLVEGHEVDGFWYKAQITGIRKSQVKVHWKGYSPTDDLWIDKSRIRRELQPGDTVKAPWHITQKQLYEGTVDKIEGDHMHIVYSDGKRKKIHFKYVHKQ